MAQNRLSFKMPCFLWSIYNIEIKNQTLPYRIHRICLHVSTMFGCKENPLRKIYGDKYYK